MFNPLFLLFGYGKLCLFSFCSYQNIAIANETYVLRINFLFCFEGRISVKMFEGAQIKMFEGAHLSQMFGKILKCAPSMFRWGTIESNTKVFAKKNIITTFACFRSTASINTSQMCPLKSYVPPGMPAVPGRLMDRAQVAESPLLNTPDIHEFISH